MVYPGAVHSRFEHSLGVYWLAGNAINRIASYQGLELGIDRRFDIQTVKLAGLLHDVGHGPFSHLFEHEFLPPVLNGSKWSHEEMSLKMIDHIIDVHNIDIEPDCHKKVKAIDLMIVDALTKANDTLKIASKIQDPDAYWKLDDTIIKTIETDPNPALKESKDLILRIRRRKLYKFCNKFVVPKDKLEHFKKVTPQDIICSQKNGVTLKEEDIAVSNVKIDLTRGTNNPVHRYVEKNWL
ncbi:HD domain-containing metal-dependent phosphohydrolase family protein [Actinidia rufa]|uniref:HD domain-containing metal-dependent phosphohydrolase family protein n=1 Tax=Actinidia rufa TaxID=165716 RepID=A0A7J0HDP4_9ERIC|nr:HD domain-containing metal-dependent phosphohydrolase family protein [Actinidia rufa]